MSGDEGSFHHEQVLLEKAVHYLQVERFDLAEKECRRALAEDPEDGSAMLVLGYALLGQHRNDEAEAEARAAIALLPHAQGFLLLSRALTQQGRHAEAERAVIDALRDDPIDSNAYECYGALLFKTGHIGRAERITRKALQFDPENADAHRLLAMILAESKKKHEALLHGEAGLRMEPDADSSHHALGIAMLQAGRPFKARQHLREALRIDPDEAAERAYLEADKACRLIYLPMYYAGWLVLKIPGHFITLWVCVLGVYFVGRQFDTTRDAARLMLLCYVVFVLYTWVVEPLTRLWMKVRPPR